MNCVKTILLRSGELVMAAVENDSLLCFYGIQTNCKVLKYLLSSDDTE